MGFFKYVDELARTVMEKDPASGSYFESRFLMPGVKALANHYIAHKLYERGFHSLAQILSQRARRRTGIEIHPGAKIGRRTFIDHGMGIVIGGTAVVGDDVTIYHGVTLGGVSSDRNAKRHPTVKDGAMLGATSVILGNIIIGENSKVGANAVVLEDVPDNSTVTGAPAKVVRMHVNIREKDDDVFYWVI